MNCWWCNAEATLLCDAAVGWERRQSDGTLVWDEPYTCDASMCNACAKRVGHVCGDEPDSIDVCPEHADWPSVDLNRLANSALDTERIRREIGSKAWRSQMTLAAAPTKARDGGET
jgi:hypothetical protein